MSLMTDAQKRQYVADLYPGQGWKHKVGKMSDDQVTAIYLKHQRDDLTPEPYSEPEPNPEPEPFLDVSRGPHHNEDQFPIY